MKHHRNSNGSAALDASGLCRALLSLRTESECEKFLTDLCTPAELEALVDRWSVVAYLEDGLPYRKIHELTGVSVTTIGRVARFLSNGNGGYRAALERLQSASPSNGQRDDRRQEHAE